MPRTGRPTARITLSDDERAELERWSRRARSARRLAFRAKLILASAAGADDTAVGAQFRTKPHTVGFWRKRFLAARLNGLLDEPRPGAPRRISDDKVEEVVVATLETTPKGATHWSTRQMAEKQGLSHTTIGRIWSAFGLKPHRSESFQLSQDPLLVEKVRDIVGLYMSPPDNALVLCVDEKSQIQALNRTQPVLPMRIGEVERRTSDYERHGTTTLFAALDIATGHVIGKCFARHRATEFLKFLREVEANVPEDMAIHIVVDNYATHKTPAVKRWLAKRPRFHLHFTPTHASWLNQVERWFGLLTQRQLKRGSHTSVAQLKAAIGAFIEVTNDKPKPFKWTATADDILGKIARFAQRTLKAHAEL
jgi:transposase